MDARVYMWTVIRDIVELKTPDIIDASYYPEAGFAVLRLSGDDITPSELIDRVRTDRMFDKVDFLPLYEWDENKETYNDLVLVIFKL